MVIPSSTTLSALATFQPSFPLPQTSLGTRRLQIVRNGQGHSISLPRQNFPSAMLSAACLNATRAVTQTENQTEKQTVKGPIATILISPLKGILKTPMLDKGGTGFPPQGGGGGDGGGGGSNGGTPSGGFYLFSLLILFDYMKELEGNDSRGDRGRRSP